MEMGRSRPINIWLSYIFTQNGFDDLENQNRKFQLRAHWLASNPIVNQVGPSSPSMEMGPSRLINIWLSCKFTQNGFHDSQNKNHRFQLRAQLLRSLEVFTVPSQSLALYTSPGWLAGWLAGYIASRTPVQKRSLFYCESYSNRALFDKIRLDPQFGASDSSRKGVDSLGWTASRTSDKKRSLFYCDLYSIGYFSARFGSTPIWSSGLFHKQGLASEISKSWSNAFLLLASALLRTQSVRDARSWCE